MAIAGKANPCDVFKHCADNLYEVLLGRVRRVKFVTTDFAMNADQDRRAFRPRLGRRGLPEFIAAGFPV